MDLNSDAWCDLVFEGKNKKYGAYYLRKTSSRRHILALIIVIGVVGAIILSLYFIRPMQELDDFESEPVNLSDLSVAEYIHFEDLAEAMAEKIPSKKEELPVFLPEIVADEDITESLDEMVDVEIPTDSVDTGFSDSSLATDQMLHEKAKYADVADEPETYMLDQTDSAKEIQSFQTEVLRFVYQNLRYPEVAYKQRIQGRVVYSFILNTDGLVSDVTLVDGIYIFLDEEVLRVIRLMPRWEPVKKEGKPVRVRCYLPVVFAM